MSLIVLWKVLFEEGQADEFGGKLIFCISFVKVKLETKKSFKKSHEAEECQRMLLLLHYNILSYFCLKEVLFSYDLLWLTSLSLSEELLDEEEDEEEEEEEEDELES